jgi:hypothetical protein
MLSRFTEILTADGEKPWRNRDDEFVNTFSNSDELMSYWDKGWKYLFNTLSKILNDDLENIVFINNEGHPAREAINRQLTHYSYHVGQIVFIAKMLKNTDWKTLSLARKRSQT